MSHLTYAYRILFEPVTYFKELQKDRAAWEKAIDHSGYFFLLPLPLFFLCLKTGVETYHNPVGFTSFVIKAALISAFVWWLRTWWTVERSASFLLSNASRPIAKEEALRNSIYMYSRWSYISLLSKGLDMLSDLLPDARQLYPDLTASLSFLQVVTLGCLVILSMLITVVWALLWGSLLYTIYFVVAEHSEANVVWYLIIMLFWLLLWWLIGLVLQILLSGLLSNFPPVWNIYGEIKKFGAVPVNLT